MFVCVYIYLYLYLSKTLLGVTLHGDMMLMFFCLFPSLTCYIEVVNERNTCQDVSDVTNVEMCFASCVGWCKPLAGLEGMQRLQSPDKAVLSSGLYRVSLPAFFHCPLCAASNSLIDWTRTRQLLVKIKTVIRWENVWPPIVLRCTTCFSCRSVRTTLLCCCIVGLE